MFMGLLLTKVTGKRCLERNRPTAWLRGIESQQNNGFTVVIVQTRTSKKGDEKMWSRFRRNMCQYQASPAFTQVGTALNSAMFLVVQTSRRTTKRQSGKFGYSCSLACIVYTQLYRQLKTDQKATYRNAQTDVPNPDIGTALSYTTHVCLHCHYSAIYTESVIRLRRILRQSCQAGVS
jgi:hypothetical protein